MVTISIPEPILEGMFNECERYRANERQRYATKHFIFTRHSTDFYEVPSVRAIITPDGVLRLQRPSETRR